MVLLIRLYGTFHSLPAWSVCTQTRSTQSLCVSTTNQEQNWWSVRHHADDRQLKTLYYQYPYFIGDYRNVRLGYSIDGLNPFGNQSSMKNTWLVVLCIYNFPSWVCMKRKYLHMIMLTQVPTQWSNDLNIYLQLFKEELDILWADEGVETWGTLTGEYFPMRGVLLMAVQNYPTYGYQSGVSHKN